MRRSIHLLSTSVAALTLFAALPAARADSRADDVAAYQQEVARGSAAFDAGNYAIARASFRAAYAIHAAPVLLFNIASTYRREGELERAIIEYRSFLAVADPNDPRRVLAAQTVADLEDQLAIQASATAPAIDDDHGLELGDVVADDEVPPDPAGIEIDDPEPQIERRASAGRPGATLRWTGIGLAAGALVTGGLAVLAGMEIERAEDSLESRDAGAPWDFEQQQLFQRGEASQQRMLLWSAATVALATAGVVLYIAGDRQRDRAALTLVPSSDGASLSLSRPF